MTRLAPRLLGLLGLLTLQAACDPGPTEPAPPQPPDGIIDARNGGDPGFSWLPPILPAAATGGRFAAALNPTLVVCVLEGAECAGEVARFTLEADGSGGGGGGGSGQLELDEAGEAYGARWETAGLDGGPDYALRVLVGTAVLGRARVDVLEPGSEPDPAPEEVRVAAGEALEVRFRIEETRPVESWGVSRAGLTGASLYDVWASPSAVFAVGSGGTILRFDGAAWTVMESATTAALFGVTGRSPEDVWAVGTGGQVLRFDGAVWRAVRQGGATLFDAWLAPNGEVFVGGAAGTVLHHDGAAWSAQVTGATDAIEALAGTSASDVYAVTGDGAVLHYDGSGWTEALRVSGMDLRDVWADPSGDVVVVGGATFEPGPVVLRRRAGEWSLMQTPFGVTFTLNAVWGSGPQDLFAAGWRNGLLHYDGSEWSIAGMMETTGGFHGIDGTAGGELFVVGEDATVLHYDYDGDAWTFDPLGPTLRAVWADSLGYAAAAGDAGVLLERYGSGWTRRLFGRDLAGVWGRSAEAVFVVGSAELMLLRDGSEWTPIGLPTLLPGRVFDFRGAPTGPMLGVGQFGAALYYDGQVALPLSNPVNSDLHGVWLDAPGRAWAVGEDGAILRFEDGGWRTVVTPASLPTLRDVWGAAPADVFTVGDGGTILHYDGTGWRGMQSPTAARLRAVWGRSGRDVYAAGDGGTLLHYDGFAWRPLDSGTALPLHDLHGSAAGEILAVGDAGLVLLGTR